MAGWGNPRIDKLVEEKGQPESVTPRNPEIDEVVGGVQTGRKAPNPTPTYRMLFSDGSYVDFSTSKSSDGSSGAREIVGGTALTTSKSDAKPTVVSGAAAGKDDQYIVTVGPDGKTTKIENPNYVAPENRKLTPAEQAAADRAKAASQADIERIKVEQQNAQTSVGRLDLDRVRAAAEAKLQQLNADVAAGRLSLEARAQQWKEYKEQNIDAPVRQAQVEAERARTAATAQNAATSAAGQALKEREYEEVTKPQAALTSGLAVAKFGRDAGQDAVSNWLKTAPLMVGDSFGANFSNALNTLSSGGGPVHFGANDFTYQIPNLDALAEEGARRAISMLKGGLGSLGAAVQAPPAVAPAPAPSPAVQPAPFPNSPDPRAVAAMNDPQVLAWLTTHGSGA